MSLLSSQLVWMLISYLATKLATKTWGRAILAIARGYAVARDDDRADAHVSRIEATRPLTAEQRARLDTEERATVDHERPSAA